MCYVFVIPTIDEEIEISRCLPLKDAKGHRGTTLWEYQVHRKIQNIHYFITYKNSSLLDFCLFLSVLYTQAILNFVPWKVNNRNTYESIIFPAGFIWAMLVFKQFMEKYVKAINKFSVHL